MRTALPDEDPFNFCAAGIAGQSSALVDFEIILKAAAAVYPVDAGSIATDAFLQHTADGRQEALGILAAETVGEA